MAILLCLLLVSRASTGDGQAQALQPFLPPPPLRLEFAGVAGLNRCESLPDSAQHLLTTAGRGTTDTYYYTLDDPCYMHYVATRKRLILFRQHSPYHSTYHQLQSY
jgi:hypothetical protein